MRHTRMHSECIKNRLSKLVSDDSLCVRGQITDNSLLLCFSHRAVDCAATGRSQTAGDEPTASARLWGGLQTRLPQPVRWLPRGHRIPLLARHHVAHEPLPRAEGGALATQWLRRCGGFTILLVGRSCVIVAHHRLSDDFLPAAARTQCDIVIFVHCFILSM